MKEKLLRILNFLIPKLLALRVKYQVQNGVALPYASLSPIDNADENGHYSRALLWAVKNRRKEDIKNIALTGAYGSGKSSILKTFQKNYEGDDLRFLNISLATFKEEKLKVDADGNEIVTDKADLLRRIETSILEQIFYHEEDKNIPDSRFKKIKSFSNKKLRWLTVGYFFFLAALYNFLDPSFLLRVFAVDTFSTTITRVLHFTSVFITALGIFSIILKSIRIISAVTINKLKIQNAEIGLGDARNKSVLNHHIDEILYFFSIRPYNVVIIEDLDRFRETEIFTKLREVNLLLNSSEKTKRKEIVFIYAVRDDMFTDKDRTKFFDFIIPVIPVINSSNSRELLYKKKKEFNYSLSDNLIEDLSLFIDDMRLLHNISNEFFLYKEKLDENLNQDRLFAVITYKNIYPNDFMKLSYNEGKLHSVFGAKKKFVKNSIALVDADIQGSKDQVNDYENIFAENVKDLRRLYVIRVLETVPGFKHFIINNLPVTLNEILEDKNFDYLKSNKCTYEHNRGYDVRPLALPKKFSEIELLVDPLKSYETCEKEVQEKRSGKINTLKSKIREAENSKLSIRNYKLAELMRNNDIEELQIDEKVNKHFFTVLLRNGYIAEDYIDYVSLFHEESLTRADYQFYLSIKNEFFQAFDFSLFKIEKLIDKLNSNDFQSDYVLNFDLVDHLLADPEAYKLQLHSIFTTLANESRVSIDFVKGYYTTTKSLQKFMLTLCKHWQNIWTFIDGHEGFPEKIKRDFLKSILEFGDIKSLKSIGEDSGIKKSILTDPLILNITDKHDKLQAVILELKLIFFEIDFGNSSEAMLQFIYEKNLYELNPLMVSSVMKKFGEFDQASFDNSNYKAILASRAQKLISYVDENIDKYVKSVYMKIEPNSNENEAELLTLLNNEKIEIENRVAIIAITDTKIEKLASVTDLALYPFLFEENGVAPTWDNLLHDYNSNGVEAGDDEANGDETTEKEISEESILFINNVENAQALSKTVIPSGENSANLFGTFYKRLIQNNEISDQAYELITKPNPWWHSDLELAGLSANKVKSLINNNGLSPIIETYTALKESFDDLHIFFFGKRKSDFLKLKVKIEFDSDDLKMILMSSALTTFEKKEIVEQCSENVTLTETNMKLLSALLLTDNAFFVSDNVLKNILLNSAVPVKERLRLFIRNEAKYEHEFISLFLTTLGGSYEQINDSSSKARISHNNENRHLLSILADKRYISSFSEVESDLRVNHMRK